VWVLHDPHTLQAVAGAQLKVGQLGRPQLQPLKVVRPNAVTAAAVGAAAAVWAARAAVGLEEHERAAWAPTAEAPQGRQT
jgi:hypothetical protein